MHRRALAPLFLLAAALLPLPAAAGIDRWTPVGPDTGVVRELAAAPSRPSTVYAGLNTGGIYRSQDGGATWAFAGNGLDIRSQINALAVDAHLPNRLWAATDTAIVRSTDGGAHWVTVRDGGARVLAADPKLSGTVYAPLGSGALQRSTDAGATWQTLPGPVTGVAALAIDPVQTQNLYAGTRTGVLLSKNRGASWQPSRRGLPASTFVLSLAIDPRVPRTVYLSISRRRSRSDRLPQRRRRDELDRRRPGPADLPGPACRRPGKERRRLGRDRDRPVPQPRPRPHLEPRRRRPAGRRGDHRPPRRHAPRRHGRRRVPEREPRRRLEPVEPGARRRRSPEPGPRPSPAAAPVGAGRRQQRLPDDLGR